MFLRMSGGCPALTLTMWRTEDQEQWGHSGGSTAAESKVVPWRLIE